MKGQFLGLLLLTFSRLASADAADNGQLDKHITIEGAGSPDRWLASYQQMTPKSEKLIYVTAKFAIDNVKTVIIIDENAVKGKCGPDQMQWLSYLTFDPEANVKTVGTRIDKPCFDGRDAVFNVRVITADGEKFYSLNTMTAHPSAFSSWSK